MAKLLYDSINLVINGVQLWAVVSQEKWTWWEFSIAAVGMRFAHDAPM